MAHSSQSIRVRPSTPSAAETVNSAASAARSPAPYMVRITTGVTALPPNMYRNFAAWL